MAYIIASTNMKGGVGKTTMTRQFGDLFGEVSK
jgi:cellulose biosynthesis protein BcsQ